MSHTCWKSLAGRKVSERRDPMTAPVFDRTKRRGEERRTASCMTRLAGTSFTAYT